MKRLLICVFVLVCSVGTIFGQMSVSEANTIIRAPYGKLPAWKRQQAWKIISQDASSLAAVAKMPVGTAPGWVRAKVFDLYPNTIHYNPVIVSGKTLSPFIRSSRGSSVGGKSSRPITYVGPRGGRYHYTKSGKKSYN